MNLVNCFPTDVDELQLLSKSNDYFVGQRVIWLFKAGTSSKNIQRIPALVVKLGFKKVQIKVQKPDNNFVNRWVNREKLEITKSVY
ncbi:hypothetical protein NIES25_47140 [Nostoc linckia NIES-25]|nr:hypothetical protein NIES25_47140 [Nostoc linckia NIES-25]